MTADRELSTVERAREVVEKAFNAFVDLNETRPLASILTAALVEADFLAEPRQELRWQYGYDSFKPAGPVRRLVGPWLPCPDEETP